MKTKQIYKPTSLSLYYDINLMNNIDSSNDSIYLLIGYDENRKSIVKNIHKLDNDYLFILEKLSSSLLAQTQATTVSNSEKPDEEDMEKTIENVLSLKEQRLFFDLIGFVNKTSFGLKFLGFQYNTLNTDDVLLFNTNSIQKAIDFYKISKNDDMVIIYMNRIRKSNFQTCSSFLGSNIDFIMKEGVFNKYQRIEIVVNSLISFTRVIYINANEYNQSRQSDRKDSLFPIFRNIVKNIVTTSDLIYYIKPRNSLMFKPIKLAESSINDMLIDNNILYENDIYLDLKIYYSINKSQHEYIDKKYNAHDEKIAISFDCPVSFNGFFDLNEDMFSVENEIKNEIIKVVVNAYKNDERLMVC